MTPDLPFLAAIYVSKGLYTISTKKQKGLGPEAHRKFETKKHIAVISDFLPPNKFYIFVSSS